MINKDNTILYLIFSKINGIKKAYKITAILVLAAIIAGASVGGLYLKDKKEKRLAKYSSKLSSGLKISFTNAQEIVDKVREGLEGHSETITVRYKAKKNHLEDIDDLVDHIMDAAMEETNKPTQGDYIRYQYGGYDADYGYSESEDKLYYTIVITPKYYTTYKQEQTVTEDINKILSEFNFNVFTTDYEKARRIYDYICENVEFDQVHRNNSKTHLKTTAYSALEYKRAVCQGFSVLLYRMLMQSGVKCRIVTGDAYNGVYNEFHAWNLIKIGNEWYNADATWDTNGRHEYFLKSDESFSDHKRGEEFSTKDFCNEYPMSKVDYKEG